VTTTRRLTACALVAVLAACGPSGSPAPPAPVVDDRVLRRDDARLVLEARCGRCHIGSYESALPRALAVFDLEEVEWSARMTPAQQREALRRVDVGLGPEGEDLGVTDAERARVHAFLDRELAGD
jgi:hypothetical protein